jgi:hypothetical protein
MPLAIVLVAPPSHDVGGRTSMSEWSVSVTKFAVGAARQARHAPVDHRLLAGQHSSSSGGCPQCLPSVHQVPAVADNPTTTRLHPSPHKPETFFVIKENSVPTPNLARAVVLAGATPLRPPLSQGGHEPSAKRKCHKDGMFGCTCTGPARVRPVVVQGKTRMPHTLASPADPHVCRTPNDSSVPGTVCNVCCTDLLQPVWRSSHILNHAHA